MPIRHMIIHCIEKKPDGNPSILTLRSTQLPESSACENLLADFNDAYNAKQGKAWGFFHAPSGAHPLSEWLQAFIKGQSNFEDFSKQAAEHLQRLMDETNIAVGGHVLISNYQQGMTDYLVIALMHHAEGVAVSDGLDVAPAKHIDLSQIHLAARINISEWQNNFTSKQYISFLSGKNGKKATDYFRDFIGCQEGIDGPSETRTLLKAFSDFVESEDLPEDQARSKTDTLVSYANSQAKNGSKISLDELSGLIDEDRPKAFYDHIRNKDYGLSPEIPPDKRTIKQFQRFTGRTDGLSISFDSTLLGGQIEFDEARDMLIIRKLPAQLKDQLLKAK